MNAVFVAFVFIFISFRRFFRLSSNLTRLEPLETGPIFFAKVMECKSLSKCVAIEATVLRKHYSFFLVAFNQQRHSIPMLVM